MDPTWLYLFFLAVLTCKQIFADSQQSLQYGIVILRRTLYNEIICYNRLKLEETDINLKTKLNIHIAAHTESLSLEDYVIACSTMAQWDKDKIHDVLFHIVFLLELSYRVDDSTFKNMMMENFDAQEMVQNFRILPYKLVQTKSQSSGLVEMLKCNFDYSKMVLQDESFIIVSAFKFVVAIQTMNPSFFDMWLVKDYHIGNKKYTAVVNEFYCMSIKNIISLTYYELIEQLQKEKALKTVSKVYHPCLLDGYTRLTSSSELLTDCVVHSAAEFSVIFEGKYNFDQCFLLVLSVITNGEVCGRNKNCNFSSVTKRFFLGEPKEISIYNDYFVSEVSSFSQLKTSLSLYNEEHCDLKSNVENVLLLVDKCFHLNIMLVLLENNYLLPDDVRVHLRKMPSDTEEKLISYLFIDSLYGSILDEEETILIYQPQPSTHTVQSSTEKDSIVESPIQEISPTKAEPPSSIASSDPETDGVSSGPGETIISQKKVKIGIVSRLKRRYTITISVMAVGVVVLAFVTVFIRLPTSYQRPLINDL